MARAPQATSSKRPVNKTGQLSKVYKLSGYKENPWHGNGALI